MEKRKESYRMYDRRMDSNTGLSCFLVISNIMSLPGKYYVVGKDDKTPSKIAYKIAIVKDALLQDTKTGGIENCSF